MSAILEVRKMLMIYFRFIPVRTRKERSYLLQCISLSTFAHVNLPQPAPETEEEMMVEIFNYTERVVNMIRPRKLLFMAIGESFYTYFKCLSQLSLL